MFALMMAENYRVFNPFLAIIAGSAIGFSCIALLTSITGNNPHPSYILRVFNIIVGVVFMVIGGFISTYLAKQKKIQYGIYTGIIIAIIGTTTIIYHTPIIYGGAIIIYIISTAYGSYLAIIVTKNLKKRI